MPRLAAIIIRQKAKTANAGKNRVGSCFLCDAMAKIRPNGPFWNRQPEMGKPDNKMIYGQRIIDHIGLFSFGLHLSNCN